MIKLWPCETEIIYLSTIFKGAIKEDLKQSASELNTNVQENNTKLEIIELKKKTQTIKKKKTDSVRW